MAAEDVAGRPIDKGIGFQRPVTEVARDTLWLDDFLLIVIGAITLFVTVLLLIVIARFNKRANPKPATFTHHALVEIVWTTVPVLILVVIAIPSLRLLFLQLDVPEPDLTIKATGNQWYWSYEYPDHGDFTFDAFLVPDDERGENQPRLLSTDENLVLPVGKKIRVLVTSSDVLHAFAMPALGAKVDAVPGRTNEIWFDIDETGMYYGQCSELCGSGHAFMPIAIQAVTQAEFDAWVVEARERFAEADDELTPRPVRIVRNDAPVGASAR
jgi:cytochrome c oxidase subunit 2